MEWCVSAETGGASVSVSWRDFSNREGEGEEWWYVL
jgi:hypothetical protein